MNTLKMVFRAVTIVSGLALCASPAFAWDQHEQRGGGSINSGNNSGNSTSNSNSNATSGAAAVSGAQSGVGSASSNLTINNGGAGTTGINYSGSYTVKDVPAVAPGSLYGGTNPCTVGVTGGLALSGFGLGLGGQWSDRGCERRNGAVILFQANQSDAAIALLCEDTDIRAAFKVSGKPCPQDLADAAAAAAAKAPVATAAPPPVMSPVPAAAPMAMPAAAPANATMAASDNATGDYKGGKPAWCSDRVKNSTDKAFHDYYCS